MSRKPTIQIKYPDASTLAMQLTDAMIRRAPGKRVVETTSEDKTGTGEGSLLDHLDSVRTSTGVEMTLTLEPNSMDYALTQLIRPNLTSEEKTAIFGEENSSTDAANCSASLQLYSGETVEVGKIRDEELRRILTDLVCNAEQADQASYADLVQTAINELNHAAGVIEVEDTADTRIMTARLAIIFYLIDHTENKRIRVNLRDALTDFITQARASRDCIRIDALLGAYLTAINLELGLRNDIPESMAIKLAHEQWITKNESSETRNEESTGELELDAGEESDNG